MILKDREIQAHKAKMFDKYKPKNETNKKDSYNLVIY